MAAALNVYYSFIVDNTENFLKVDSIRHDYTTPDGK